MNYSKAQEKQVKLIVQQIGGIASDKTPDLALACQLALNMPTEHFTLVDSLFKKWISEMESFPYESQRLLSEVYLLHATKEDSFDLSSFDLIPEVQLNWLVTLLTIHPEQALNFHDRHILSKAMELVKMRTMEDLELLIQLLIDIQYPEFNDALFRLIEYGTLEAKISYSTFRKATLFLLKSDRVNLVWRACQLIEKNSFCFEDKCPEIELRILINRGNEFELLGIKTLSTWGENTLFWEILGDSSSSPESKMECFVALAAHPSEKLIYEILPFLTQYPEHGTFIIFKLLAHAQDGLYCGKSRLDHLLNYYFEYELLNTFQLVALINPKLHFFLDPKAHLATWEGQRKWILLLQELQSVHSEQELLSIYKTNLFPDHKDLVLKSIFIHEVQEWEEAILDQFDSDPILSLKSLRKHGGQKTVQFLTDILRLNGLTETQHIPFYAQPALELILFLSDDHSPVLNFIYERELPFKNDLIAGLKIGHNPMTSVYLIDLLKTDCSERHIQLSLDKLMQIGTPEGLPTILKLLLHEDEEMADKAWKTAINIANRAYREGKLEPKRLLNQTCDNATNAALSGLLIAMLQKSSTTAHIQVLLTHLGKCMDDQFDLDQLSELSQSENPHIIKFYLENLGNSQHKKAFIHIKNYLRLDQDIFTLRQAIMALTKMYSDSHEEFILPHLTHRNMNIKKCVAAYLHAHGSDKAISSILRLLKFNDNSGLRTTLIEALYKISDQKMRFILINEMTSSTSDKERNLLGAALIEGSESCGLWISPNIRSHFIFSEVPILAEWSESENSKKSWEFDCTSFVKTWKFDFQKTNSLLKKAATADKKKPLLDQIEDTLASKELLGNFLNKHIEAGKNDALFCSFAKKWKVIVHPAMNLLFYTTSTGSNRAHFWDKLALQKDKEELEWQNMRTYDNSENVSLLVTYFTKRKGLRQLFYQHTRTTMMISSLKSGAVVNGAYSIEVVSLIAETLNNLTGAQTEEMETTRDVLLSWILSIPGFHRNSVKKNLFLEGTDIQKLETIQQMDHGEQSLYKGDIASLYQRLDVRSRQMLLQNIRNIYNHPLLVEISFQSYLKNQKDIFWESEWLTPDLINLLITHDLAIDFFVKNYDQIESLQNKFILEIMYEFDIWSDLLHGFKYAFSRLPLHRQWTILKPEIQDGKWHFLDLISNHTSILSDIDLLLQNGTQDDQKTILTWLSSLKKPLYFPLLEDRLLSYCKEWNDPILAFNVLFCLQLDRAKKETQANVTKQVLNSFSSYNNSIKADVLSCILTNEASIHYLTRNPLFIQQLATFCQDKALRPLMIELRIKALEINTLEQINVGIKLIHQFFLLDKNKGLRLLEELLLYINHFRLQDQMQILENLFNYSEFQSVVIDKIANIFCTEFLAISFISDENKETLEHLILKRALDNKPWAELDRKLLLKALAEDPSPYFIKVLQQILNGGKQKSLENLSLRLLRKVMSKPAYLAVCARIIENIDVNDNADIIRTSIRTLSFSRNANVSKMFIKLIFHKNDIISKTAKDGLVQLGSLSLNSIAIELPKLRPDKKSILQDIVTEIEQNTNNL